MSVKRYVITQTGVRILDQKEAREYDVSNRFVNEEDYAAKCLDLESSRDTVTALEAENARLREEVSEWRMIAGKIDSPILDAGPT